jgi:hypothetical protein
MAKIISLRKFFKQAEKPYSFKRGHYLNQIPAHRREEILLFSEGDYLSTLWPTFERKKVLFFNDQKHKYIFKKILTDEPGYLVNYVYRGPDVSEQKMGYHTVIGDMENLSIRRKHFDVVICPFALEDGPFIEGFIKKVSECLDNGSRLILSLSHPQLDNILCNQNPSSSHVAESQVSRYHELLKNNNLYVEDIKEGTVDLALKAFFTDSEYDYYHEYKNTPISLLFRTVKYTRKVSSSQNGL